MDIVSHGLWGGIAFGRKNRKKFWLAFFAGVAPDLFSFGFFTAGTVFGVHPSLNFENGPPDPALVPGYVHALYDVTHSLVVFAVVFAALWYFLRRPVWEFAPWGLHILMDIPTHSSQFFPTPFLWPVSDFTVDGIPWSHPWIFVPNVAVLAILSIWFFIVLPRMRRAREQAAVRP